MSAVNAVSENQCDRLAAKRQVLTALANLGCFFLSRNVVKAVFRLCPAFGPPCNDNIHLENIS